MADRAIAFMTEVLAASKVPTNPVRCPRCDGENLVLYGQLAYPARLTYADGQLVDQNVDFEVKENFEMTSMDCLHCHVRYEVQPDAENMLYLQNSDLRERYRQATGQDPYGERKC